MTPERSRDDTVDALLRSMTDGEDSRSSTGCPEPGVLAARYERALTKEESAHLDGHLASCDRCRPLLGLIVQSEPAEPAESARGGWLMRPRWLVPTVATLAASAMLWVAIDPTRQLEEPQRQTDLASAARQRVIPQEPARPNAGPQSEAPAPRPEQAAPASTEQARVPPEPAPAAPATTEQARVPPEPAPAAPAATEQARVPPEPAPAAAGVQTQRREARRATAPADADAQERALSGVAAASIEAVAIEVPSLADPLVHWRLGAGGAIDRSRDGGASWQVQDSGTTVDLLAGSAPSITVCWAAGRDGVIIRTTDGSTWTRVDSPTADDVIGVDASDARVAVVTTRTGERIRTENAGRTWTPVP